MDKKSEVHMRIELARTMPKLERPPCGSEEPMSTQEAEAGKSMMQDAR
jgi:hypothetical protein